MILNDTVNNSIEPGQTREGKVKSSLNSTTHGIFVKRFLNGAAPEAVAEVEALAAGIREHYQPLGVLEEMLVQKIVVEAARYGRVLGYELEQIVRPHAFHLSALDRLGRYTTATSRALFHAIKELERLQAAREAVEHAADSSEAAAPENLQPEEQVASPGTDDNHGKSSTPTEATGDVAA